MRVARMLVNLRVKFSTPTTRSLSLENTGWFAKNARSFARASATEVHLSISGWERLRTATQPSLVGFVMLLGAGESVCRI